MFHIYIYMYFCSNFADFQKELEDIENREQEVQRLDKEIGEQGFLAVSMEAGFTASDDLGLKYLCCQKYCSVT